MLRLNTSCIEVRIHLVECHSCQLDADIFEVAFILSLILVVYGYIHFCQEMKSNIKFDNHVLLNVNNASLFTINNVILLLILLLLLLKVVVVEGIRGIGLEGLSFAQRFV
jgi:hypothetical protein